MEKGKTGRVYSSEKLSKELNEIEPLEMEKVRVKMHLAATIEEIMNKKGFCTQKAFAKHTKRNPSEINKWLSGIHNFTIDTLVEIKWELGVSMHDFFKKEVSASVVYFQSISTTAQAVAPGISIMSPHHTTERRTCSKNIHSISISEPSTGYAYQIHQSN